MSDFAAYLGLHYISAFAGVIYICLIAVGCVAYVMWHAHRRLKLSEKQLRETEWPNR